MTIENYHWVATHSDKTVEKPNYADINRDTLLTFTLFKKKGGDFIAEFTNPNEGKFKLACRLRTAGSPAVIERNGQEAAVLLPRRRMIVVYDGKEYTIIGSDYDINKINDLSKLDLKPFVFAENLGEEA